MDGYYIPLQYFYIFLIKVTKKTCVNFHNAYVAADSLADGKAAGSVSRN